MSCKLSLFETVCMKCQNLFSGKSKKCTVQPVLSKHPRDNPDGLLKTGACLIQVNFNKFAFLGN